MRLKATKLYPIQLQKISYSFPSILLELVVLVICSCIKTCISMAPALTTSCITLVFFCKIRRIAYILHGSKWYCWLPRFLERSFARICFDRCSWRCQWYGQVCLQATAQCWTWGLSRPTRNHSWHSWEHVRQTRWCSVHHPHQWPGRPLTTRSHTKANIRPRKTQKKFHFA